jgi:CRP-like cAMP-binding protein
MTKSDYKFKKFIEPFGLTDSDFDLLINYCEIVQFKKGDIVIHEGVKQNHIYFICKGIIRNFVLSQKGEIITYGFRIEDMLITGYGLHNFKDEFKALVSVECLEPCEMIKIPLTALKFMEENSKDAQKVARYIAEVHIVDLVNFIISADTKSLIERYDDLEKLFPNIHQRVPQHIIAAYLRISRVHLSRIKKSRLKL